MHNITILNKITQFYNITKCWTILQYHRLHSIPHVYSWILTTNTVTLISSLPLPFIQSVICCTVSQCFVQLIFVLFSLRPRMLYSFLCFTVEKNCLPVVLEQDLWTTSILTTLTQLPGCLVCHSLVFPAFIQLVIFFTVYFIHLIFVLFSLQPRMLYSFQCLTVKKEMFVCRIGLVWGPFQNRTCGQRTQ